MKIPAASICAVSSRELNQYSDTIKATVWILRRTDKLNFDQMRIRGNPAIQEKHNKRSKGDKTALSKNENYMSYHLFHTEQAKTEYYGNAEQSVSLFYCCGLWPNTSIVSILQKDVKNGDCKFLEAQQMMWVATHELYSCTSQSFHRRSSVRNFSCCSFFSFASFNCLSSSCEYSRTKTSLPPGRRLRAGNGASCRLDRNGISSASSESVT